MHGSHDDLSWMGVVVILLIAFALTVISSVRSSNRYNNGICKRCGGHYVYQQAVGHRYDTSYIYQCDKCGNLIETNDFYPERQNVEEESLK